MACATKVQSAKMTTKEIARLEVLEEKIRTGLRYFCEVGEALIEIREKKLYRADYKTFEAYCQGRWKFTAERARLLMQSVKAVQNVREHLESKGEKVQPMVGVPGGGFPLPANERQARPLVNLPPEVRGDVWEEAVETVPDDEEMTAAHIEEVARKAFAALPPEKQREMMEVGKRNVQERVEKVRQQVSVPKILRQVERTVNKLRRQCAAAGITPEEALRRFPAKPQRR